MNCPHDRPTNFECLRCCDDAMDESWLELAWPDTLGHNLGFAGALCRAFDLALNSYWCPRWYPGCQREAPEGDT